MTSALRAALQADDPLILWGLGEVSGNALNLATGPSSLGSTFQGVFNGSPTRTTASLDTSGDGSVTLDGIDDEITCAAPITLSGSFSISISHNRPTPGAAGTRIIHHAGPPAPNFLFIYTAPEPSGFYLKVEHGSAIFDTFPPFNPLFSYSANHRIALTYDASSGEFRLYVDGVVVRSLVSEQAPMAGKTFSIGRIVGGVIDGIGPHDEFALFGYVLTPAQILAHWNASSAPPPSDTTPPTCSITAPPAGGVSGMGPISASASDDVSVAGVQFDIDGTPLGAEDTSAPYGLTWNSTTVADGSHTIGATARDTSNNFSTRATIIVNVSNAVPPPPPTVNPPFSFIAPTGPDGRPLDSHGLLLRPVGKGRLA